MADLRQGDHGPTAHSGIHEPFHVMDGSRETSTSPQTIMHIRIVSFKADLNSDLNIFAGKMPKLRPIGS